MILLYLIEKTILIFFGPGPFRIKIFIFFGPPGGGGPKKIITYINLKNINLLNLNKKKYLYYKFYIRFFNRDKFK